ncbi:MAG: hypothetical protein ACI9J2_001389 [Saprospiraceae bacterium]|jgi:hypothetical protein
MYASSRKYEITGSEADLIQRAEQGFLPVIKQVSGFVDYYIFSAGNNVVNTASIFESAAQMQESDELAAKWVSENMASFVVGTPEITQGEIRLKG